MTKISVIMNCYNGETYVKEAIESVFAQTLADWEIIFWDNASTDGTAAIARSFIDPRMRYFRASQNVPLGGARKLAMTKATGDWIAFVDHDDACLPLRFERQLGAVEGGEFAICYGGMREIDDRGRVLRDIIPRHRTGERFADLLVHFEANLQTTMVRRDYLERFGIEFDPTFTMFEDFDLFMRLAAKGPVCVVPEVLCLCRVLHASATERSLKSHAPERLTTLKRLRAENPGIVAEFPRAFREAEARAQYYKARYEMQSGCVIEARRTMRAIRGNTLLYRLLYLMTFWPTLWNAAHDRHMKSHLTGIILRIPGLRRSRPVA